MKKSKTNTKRKTKIKRLINKYNREEINFQSEKDY